MAYIPLSLGVATNGLTLNTIDQKLQLGTAGSSSTGALTSTDWNSFNNRLSNVLTDGYIWVGNGSNIATPVSISGDASITNAGVLSLTAVGTSGTYGSSSQVPQITTDSKGRITSVSLISIGGGSVTSVGMTVPSFLSVTPSTITTSGTFAVSLTSQSANIILASPDGTSGTPSFRALVAADLPTVTINRGGTGLTTTPTNGQILIGNGTNYSLSTITGTINQVNVTNGSGSITLSLPQDVATSSTPTFTQLLITNSPTLGNHAINKSYLDGVLNGISWKAGVRFATTTTLPTYTATTTTLTATANGAFSTTDGVTPALNDSVLIKNEIGGNQAYNGIYTITTLGSGGTPWVLTRRSDTNTGAALLAAAVFIQEGTLNADKGFNQITDGTIILGTTSIVWVQNFGSNLYIADGSSLTLTGNTFSITTGGITDTYISASAAITRSKLAAGSNNQVIINNGSGVLTSEATLAVSRGGVNTSIAPTSGQILVASGTTAYAPVSLSGDATINSSGVLSLATTSVSAGSYTYASFTVDAAGRLTAASNGTTPITGSLTSGRVALSSGSSTVTDSANLLYASTTGTGGLTISNTTSSTSITTGALIVSGGLGISGSFYLQGDIKNSTNNTYDIGDATNRFKLLYLSTGINNTGSFSANYTLNTSTSFTAGASHYFVNCDTSTGNQVANLPAASGLSGRMYIFKKLDSGINTITITPNGADTIDGAANRVIDVQFHSVVVISNGSNGWSII